MKKIILLIAFCITANQAFAYVYGGTNLSYSGYPKPSCFLYSDDEYAVRRYINCINKYVEDANNDIERIREAAQEAVRDAKIRLLIQGYY